MDTSMHLSIFVVTTIATRVSSFVAASFARGVGDAGANTSSCTWHPQNILGFFVLLHNYVV